MKFIMQIFKVLLYQLTKKQDTVIKHHDATLVSKLMLMFAFYYIVVNNQPFQLLQ